jgi:hypothetical protein
MTQCLVWFAEPDKLTSRWQWLLAPGFRHCGVAVQVPQGWIMVEDTGLTAHLAFYQTTAFALTRELETHGCVVVAAKVQPAWPRPWLRPLTCVELVKHVLGLRAWRVWTPLQLYRRLKREERLCQPTA